MFDYTDPTNAQLSEVLIYGKENGKTSTGRCIFTSPVTLELYGSLIDGNYTSQYAGSNFSKENYSLLGMDKLQGIKAFSISELTLPPSYPLDTPYYGGYGHQGTLEQETIWQESNKVNINYYSKIFNKIKTFYSEATGISVLNGVVSSSAEDSPTDFSCFYPYSRISLYLGSVVFNCLLYRSGILLVLGYQVFENNFDFNLGLSNIEESFRDISL